MKILRERARIERMRRRLEMTLGLVFVSVIAAIAAGLVLA